MTEAKLCEYDEKKTLVQEKDHHFQKNHVKVYKKQEEMEKMDI
jgi:hypothetical protein